MKRLLLLGHSGKMGTAIKEVFANDYEIIPKNSSDFDAKDFSQVQRLVKDTKPDILINATAFLGIDPCEMAPEQAFKINALYPRLLAQLSNEQGFLLVHFSTDAVFDDSKQDYYIESDCCKPVNVYGMTKFAGDCFIECTAKQFYILRVPILFGPTPKNTQFVEKMLSLIKDGKKTLLISQDIVSSPTYSIDVATRLKELISNGAQYGLYHLTNSGIASLYDLMKEIVKNLNLDVKIEPCSYRDFVHIGKKNTYTPLSSEKLHPLRTWQDAVHDYCKRLKGVING